MVTPPGERLIKTTDSEDVKFGYGRPEDPVCPWGLTVEGVRWGCVRRDGHWFRHKMSPNPPIHERGCNAYVELSGHRHFCQLPLGSYTHFPSRNSTTYIHQAGEYVWHDPTPV